MVGNSTYFRPMATTFAVVNSSRFYMRTFVEVHWAEPSNSTVIGFSYVELVDITEKYGMFLILHLRIKFWLRLINSFCRQLQAHCYPQLVVDNVIKHFDPDLYQIYWALGSFEEPPRASFHYKGYAFFFRTVSYAFVPPTTVVEDTSSAKQPKDF